ncbi:MAG: DNA/RNA non-specific endonuclease [Pseudomonadota bacterium]
MPAMHRSLFAGLVLAALLSSDALAGGCPAHYLGGQLPEIRNPKLAQSTQELCYGVFGVMHSGVTRTPLWSAELLKSGNIAQAHALSRENSFHAEPRLPSGVRAELADYAHSGYDRGHMAPNGDMPDRETQHESFTLANMVPQDAENNRHLWAGIEGAVRGMAKKDGELYVVTGPAFIGGSLQKVGHVLVPTHLYKAVYSPRQNAGAAWFVENKGDAEVQTISITELEGKIGINLMPALSAQQKQAMLRLPTIRKGRK